jgi:hypothetical protein
VAGDKFKVFISWSGELAKAVAFVWNDLLKLTYDAVEPFMSEAGIGAGERGLNTIAAKLADTSFGIVVVTQENENSPWLNFEAGALSKPFNDAGVRVAPSLVDFDSKSDLEGPLNQFQGGLLDREGVRFILIELGKMIDADQPVFQEKFELLWPRYEAKFAEAKTQGGNATPNKRRPDPEILDEILLLVRTQTYGADAVLSVANTAQTNASLAITMSHLANSLISLIDLAPGDHVRHTKLGDGLVMTVDGTGTEARSLIDFGTHGKKLIHHNTGLISKAADPAGKWRLPDNPADPDPQPGETDDT